MQSHGCGYVGQKEDKNSWTANWNTNLLILGTRKEGSWRASLLILGTKKEDLLEGWRASLLILKTKKEDFLEGWRTNLLLLGTKKDFGFRVLGLGFWV